MFAVTTWAITINWLHQASAENPERLTPDDIVIAEPLQVPLSAAKPPADQPAPETGAEQTPKDPTSPMASAVTEKKGVETDTPTPPPVEKKTSSDSPPSSPSAETAAASSKPKSGWLGLTVDDSLVTGRLVIVEVTDPSPAHSVGLQPQDVLLAIDGEPLQTADQLAAVLAAIPPQKQVQALIGRTDGVQEVTMTAGPRPVATRSPTPVAVTPSPASERTATAPPAASRFSTPEQVASPGAPASANASGPTTSEPPTPASSSRTPASMGVAGSRFGQPNERSPAALPPPQASPLPSLPPAPPTTANVTASVFQGRTALGVRTVSIDTSMQARYGLAEPRGAYVLGVIESLPAAQAGLPPGSVIVAFDNRPIRSPADLNQLVTESPPGRLISLEYVLPGGEAKRAEIELQALDPALERALTGVPTSEPQQPQTTPRVTQRPIPKTFPELPFNSTGSTTASEDALLLRQELGLLREEVLRLRSRLDQLEQDQLPQGRGRGDMLR
jgi:membrane-associated protease RseP (regulator of RpoE activity)